MAQKIVTMCDAHMRSDEEVPAAAWEVTLLAPGETKPTTWAVDLCRDDGKTLEDLAVMLSAVGRITEGPKRTRRAAARATLARESTPTPAASHTAPQEPPTAGKGYTPVPCPVAGCDKVPDTAKALASHLRQYHDGMTVAAAFGRPEPYACPEPGCDFKSARPQGLGAHRKAIHGTAGASRAVEFSGG